MNEPSARTDSKHCPICRAKIPFSLALHMVAVHSPEAMARNAEAMDTTVPNYDVHAAAQVRQNSAGEGRGPQRPRRGGQTFGRGKGKRRH